MGTLARGKAPARQIDRVIRQAIDHRRLSPSDCSALKGIDRAIERAARKWTLPIQEGRRVLNRFALPFEGRRPLSSHRTH